MIELTTSELDLVAGYGTSFSVVVRTGSISGSVEMAQGQAPVFSVTESPDFDGEFVVNPA